VLPIYISKPQVQTRVLPLHGPPIIMSEFSVNRREKVRDGADLDTDDRVIQGLEKLGYKQELLRVRSYRSLFT
jgi:hypothetical protein